MVFAVKSKWDENNVPFTEEYKFSTEKIKWKEKFLPVKTKW